MAADEIYPQDVDYQATAEEMQRELDRLAAEARLLRHYVGKAAHQLGVPHSDEQLRHPARLEEVGEAMLAAIERPTSRMERAHEAGSSAPPAIRGQDSPGPAPERSEETDAIYLVLLAEDLRSEGRTTAADEIRKAIVEFKRLRDANKLAAELERVRKERELLRAALDNVRGFARSVERIATGVLGEDPAPEQAEPEQAALEQAPGPERHVRVTIGEYEELRVIATCNTLDVALRELGRHFWSRSHERGRGGDPIHVEVVDRHGHYLDYLRYEET